MRIVLDTNVLVSGMLSPTGLPSLLIKSWEDGEFTLITSVEQRIELERVLGYEKLARFIRTDQSARLLANLAAAAELVLNLPAVRASTDDADNLILATALGGKASHVVTGDKRHLLNVQLADITIVTPKEMLRILAAPTSDS